MSDRKRRPGKRGFPRRYTVGLLALVAVLLALSIGPLQRLGSAAARVEALEGARASLEARASSLEARSSALENPTYLELEARRELGMVREGEIPYVVPDAPRPSPQPLPSVIDEPPARPGSGANSLPWYERLSRGIGALFDAVTG